VSATDKTARGQSETIHFEFEFRHPAAKVWRALTEPELLAKWLLPVVGFEPTPGASFRFQAEPVGGWDGIVNCRLLEIEEMRRLRYTWVVGDMDTVVTFTLEPTPNGTRLFLEHSGFREHQKRNFGGARYGWRLMGEKLVELLDEPSN
jgi:uncharacterized protein YndB with AHSA1/START domain